MTGRNAQTRAGPGTAAHEDALRRVLQVISRSREDEAPVFDSILEAAADLCDAPFAGLYLVDAARREIALVASRGARTEYLKGRDRRWPMDDPASVGVAIRECRIEQADDIRDTEAYRQGNRQRVEAADIEGIRTFLAVPLIRDGRAIGCIGLYRREVSRFSDEAVALVETFAEQAVIAIDNARQFREVQERLEREAATREILEVISRSREDAAPVFDMILQSAARLCDAPLAFLTMTDDARSAVTVPAHLGARPEFARVLDGFVEPLDRTELVAVRPIAEGVVVHVDDIKDDPLYRQRDPRRVQMVEVEGARTAMGVPLMRGGVAIGAIVLYRREVKPFSEDQIALIETFAAQAVIAIENVRQFREVQERLEREVATNEVLDVISRSRDDERPVFEAILDKAQQLCNAPMSALILARPEDDSQVLAAWRGLFEKAVELFETGQMKMDANLSYAARSIVDGRLIALPDMAQSDLYKAGSPVVRSMVDESGIRSVLFVPLIRGGTAIGTITLFRKEFAPFGAQEIALVQTFAAQAVIAIENVRQFREVQTRLERERASAEVLEVISRSRADTAPVFAAILESAARLCAAPHALLLLPDAGRTHLELVASNTAQSRFIDSLIETPHSLANKRSGATLAFDTGKTQHVPDVRELFPGADRAPQLSFATDIEGMRTVLLVPLLSGGRSVGVISVYKLEVAPFSDDEIALVETFAAQAVIAIENVHQFREVQARTAEVEALNAGLETRVSAQVDELERMGRLKRFLSPQVADAVVSSGDEAMLGSHRALIAILFCDIRGFTAFCESAEPEEAIEVLQTYHEAMGKLIQDAGAGFDTRAGDGIMVVFNDPIACDDPAGAALDLALAMRARMAGLCTGWRRLGHRLGFGTGIALGYATVGMVGFEGRYDYTASGTAVNLASRLCDHAEDGDVLLSPRAAAAVEERVALASAGHLELKGFHAPVEVFRVEADPG